MIVFIRLLIGYTVEQHLANITEDSDTIFLYSSLPQTNDPACANAQAGSFIPTYFSCFSAFFCARLRRMDTPISAVMNDAANADGTPISMAMDASLAKIYITAASAPAMTGMRRMGFICPTISPQMRASTGMAK